MTSAKILLGVALFLAAVGLFVFGPDHGDEALRVGGMDLDSRTATALSIILMVFGVILALKAVAERYFVEKSRT